MGAIAYHAIGRGGGGKRRRSASRGTRPLGFSFSWNASRTCTRGGVLRSDFIERKSNFFLRSRSLTYRAVKKTTGIHAQVQASRDTLDPQLTPGHGCSLKYRWKGKKINRSVREISLSSGIFVIGKTRLTSISISKYCSNNLCNVFNDKTRLKFLFSIEKIHP